MCFLIQVDSVGISLYRPLLHYSVTSPSLMVQKDFFRARPRQPTQSTGLSLTDIHYGLLFITSTEYLLYNVPAGYNIFLLVFLWQINSARYKRVDVFTHVIAAERNARLAVTSFYHRFSSQRLVNCFVIGKVC